MACTSDGSARATQAELLATYAAGRVDLDRYRGRSAYSFPVQAAEQAIRESEELLGIGDLTFLGSSSQGDEAWRVLFQAPDTVVHELDVVATIADEPVPHVRFSRAEAARRHTVTAHRVLSR